MNRKHWVAMAAAGALAVTGTAGASAAVTSAVAANGTINGCYRVAAAGDDDGQQGQLRVLAADQRCKKNELAIQWNQKGPKGDIGAQGIAGQAGPKGDAGTPGAVGAAGPTGPLGLTGSAGPVGPVGPAGQSGPTATAVFTGVIDSIPGFGERYVFAGPTAAIVVTAGQRLVGAASVLVRPIAGTANFRLGLCYRNGLGPILQIGNSPRVEAGQVRVAQVAVSFGIAPLGAGTYSVGACILNFGFLDLNSNDDVNGWVMATG